MGSALCRTQAALISPSPGLLQHWGEPARNQRCKRWQCAERLANGFGVANTGFLGSKVLASSNLGLELVNAFGVQLRAPSSDVKLTEQRR